MEIIKHKKYEIILKTIKINKKYKLNKICLLIIYQLIIIIINKIQNYEIFYERKIKNEIINLIKYYEICNKGILLNKRKFNKNDNPKVSIISAIHNREKTLIRLLRSIQNQLFDDVEIILVDDCSTDNSIKLIQEYQKEDQRILLIKNKINKGTLISRNIGVLKAKGKYIIIPDSDDIFAKDIINVCYKIAIKNNYEIIRYNVYEGQNKDGLMKIVEQLESKQINQPELSTYLFYGLGYLCLNEFTLWNKFIKREAFIRTLNNINLFYLNQYMVIFEDGLINYALYRNNKSLYLLKKIGYYYIFNNINSIQFNSKIKYDLPKYFFLYIKFILENSNNTKYQKDMALHIFHLYNNHAQFINLVNKNFQLYKDVINFFLHYKYISLKDKIQFKNLENIIKQNEKQFKNNGIKSAYKTI